MSRRRWDFDEGPPWWMMRSNSLTIEQILEAKEWYEKLEKMMEKKGKKEDEAKKARMFHQVEVFLILVGCSPLIALLYKVFIIPVLLR